MISISKVVYGVIGIVVAVLIVATVLIPTVDGLHLDNQTYTTLLGVVCTLAIIIPVMMAVRLIGGDKD